MIHFLALGKIIFIPFSSAEINKKITCVGGCGENGFKSSDLLFQIISSSCLLEI